MIVGKTKTIFIWRLLIIRVFIRGLTVSLQHITDSSAEFAITVRTIAMGKGYSKYGMQKIFDLGRKQISLKDIYWCISPENKRVIRFYDKNVVNCKGYTIEQINYFIWYHKTFL